MGLLRLLLLCLLVAGCGYHVQGRGGNLPGDVRTVFIELFSNRTLEPFLENEVTNEATARFARGRAAALAAGMEGADAVLSGTVTAYETTPIAYDGQDNILEYRSTMAIGAVLSRPESGVTLWKGSLSWSEEYPASADKSAQEDNEAAAIRVIAERLADELYFRLADNF